MASRTRVELAVELLDDRQEVAHIDIGDAAGDDGRIVLLVDEALGQIVGQDAHIFLELVGRVLAGLGEPAAQGLDRPDIADARLGLDDGVNVADHLQHVGVVERLALGPIDHDVKRIGAGQLLVELLGGSHGLLAIGHLVGQAIARRQRGVDGAEAR